MIKLILTRKMFIQEMLEFEVIASDPRRLFKNSAQLNKEEQFRHSAYPTLLGLEDQIRVGLTDFEKGQNLCWFQISFVYRNWGTFHVGGPILPGDS